MVAGPAEALDRLKRAIQQPLPDEDFGMCSCGSGWFMVDSPEPGEGGGVVGITPDGDIDTYAGILVCVACSEPWSPSD